MNVGDSGGLVFNQSGELQTRDAVFCSMKGLPVTESRPLQTENHSLGGRNKYSVINWVSANNRGVISQIEFKVSVGDRIVLASDGVLDNLTVEEIGGLIANKSPDEAIKSINTKVQERWKIYREIKNRLCLLDFDLKDEGFSGDALKEELFKRTAAEFAKVGVPLDKDGAPMAKPDHASIVIIDIERL